MTRTHKLFPFFLILALLIRPVQAANGENRIYGDDRYETNKKLVESLFDSAETAIIASGKEFADAVSSYNLAVKYQAPIIIMDNLENSTYGLLKDLGVKNIIIVGGTGNLSTDLEYGLSKNFSVRRIAGSNRYETSRLVYEETKDFFGDLAPIEVAGQTFQEPLIATGLAKAENRPFLLNPDLAANCLKRGQDLIQASSIGEYNEQVNEMVQGQEVIAQLASFPDSISAINYSIHAGAKISLKEKVPVATNSIIVGGPSTFAVEEENSQASLSSAKSDYQARLEVPSADSPYYNCPKHNPFVASGYGSFQNGGNCTSYAYGRAYEILGEKPKLSTGNAMDFWSYNQAHQAYPSGSQPKLGSVMVQGPYQWSSVGHVAIVEEVYDDGSFLTSESAWQSDLFRTRHRTVENTDNLLGFIYLGDF